MSILGNINKLIDEDDNAYTTPAVIRDDKDYISFKKAFVLSLLLHPTAVALVALLSFVMLFFGINLLKLDRPKAKMNDIEFVLVEKEAQPINKKTPYRADINSRAGGKHDPKRKVSMPSPKPAKTQKASQASPTPKKQVVKKQTVRKQSAPAKKVVTKQQTTQKTQAKTSLKPSKTVSAPKPAAPSVKPSARPVAAPKVTTTPKTSFNVPVPPKTSTGKLSTGPVGGSGKRTSHAGGAYSPTPSLAPTYGSGSGSRTSSSAGAGSRGTSASRGGSGNYGNPGPGNPNGRPGIDAVAQPDFGPYMRDLQRRIKMNWDPPKGNESKRVVLLFKIAKDGRLLSCSVYKSSGLPAADKAAINAVQLTAPFRPLPANFRGSSIDIQFTFDYNVFGASYR
ncbi:MAG: TonB family protein [Candidatus Gastranaerophilaceae bacterium]